MNKLKHEKFQNVFGKKAIIAGVYTTDDKPQRMADEIKLLNDLGVKAAYLENVTSFDNPSQIPRDIKTIDKALEIAAKHNLDIKLGVNILPNYKGTEHESAFYLAKNHKLSFIDIDLIAGSYTLGNGGIILELNEKTYNFYRENNPNIIIFGGISVNTPYSKYAANDDPKPLLDLAAKRSDALLAKTRPGENEVSKELIFAYAEISGLPVVGASKYTLNNIANYVNNKVDAFIIGSGLRDKDGKLHTATIQEMEKILSEYRI